MPALPFPPNFNLSRHPKLVSSLTPLASKSMMDLVRQQPLAGLTAIRQQAIRAKVSLRRQQLDAQVIANRAAVQKQKIQIFTGYLVAAKTRLTTVLKNSSLRSPAAVTGSFIQRLGVGVVSPVMPASVLVDTRTGEVQFPAVLAATLNLTVAQLVAKKITYRKLVTRANGIHTYAVRFPGERQAMKIELHNLAWAMRQHPAVLAAVPDGLPRASLAVVAPQEACTAPRSYAEHLALTRVLEAQALPPQPTGKRFGEGIIIAHPDTGWAEHPDYNGSQIDKASAKNIATGRSEDAKHSVLLQDKDLFNITHGTATGSIILGCEQSTRAVSTLREDALRFPTESSGDRAYGTRHILDDCGALVGVAPKATMRPIKFIQDTWALLDQTGFSGAGVFRFLDEDLVAAIDYARTSGSHVISMSVGGLLHDAVRQALDTAIMDSDIIVVAAAGQTYADNIISTLSSIGAKLSGSVDDSVIVPAAYQNVIAVAGCSRDGRPWKESHRGPNIDITAPADGIWVAEFSSTQTLDGKRKPVLECASGTSFAASFMAGVAALWLAHWDRAMLIARYRPAGIPLAWVFRHQLQFCATAAHVGSWDTDNFGPGLVNVKALLELPLPDSKAVKAPPKAVGNLVMGLSFILENLPPEIQQAWALLWDLGSASVQLAEQIARAAVVIASAMARAVQRALEEALAQAEAALEAAGVAATQAMRDAVTAIDTALQDAADAVADAAEAVADAGKDAVDAVEEVAETLLDTVGEAAQSFFDWIWQPS
jgi:subtilisin family serine protease